MPLCQFCHKEFKDVEKHIRKRHSDKQETQVSFKTYSPGDVVVYQNSRFQVEQDLGTKLLVKKEGSNFLKLTIKKERL